MVDLQFRGSSVTLVVGIVEMPFEMLFEDVAQVQVLGPVVVTVRSTDRAQRLDGFLPLDLEPQDPCLERQLGSPVACLDDRGIAVELPQGLAGLIDPGSAMTRKVSLLVGAVLVGLSVGGLETVHHSIRSVGHTLRYTDQREEGGGGTDGVPLPLF